MLRKRLLEVRPVVCVVRVGIVGIVGRERVLCFFEGRVELGSGCPN